MIWVEFVGGPRDGEVWPRQNAPPRIYVEQAPVFTTLVTNTTNRPLPPPEPLIYERRRGDKLRVMTAAEEFPVRYDLLR